MTQQYPPQQPYQPQPAAPQPPEKANPLTSKPVIAVAALVVGLVLGSVAGGSGKASTASVAAAAPTVTVTATETATYEADDSTDDTTTTTGEPTKDDFVIKLKVTSKQCFGSAGCNVTTKASVSYVGSGSTDDLPSYIDITYKIKGGEEPYTATIEMEDGQYTPDRAVISTRRSSDKLTAVVTEVETY